MSSWSHEFENVWEDRWAGVVDTDTRVRYLFYNPPPADSDPIQPSVARSEPISNERQIFGMESAVATVAKWPMAVLDP